MSKFRVLFVDDEIRLLDGLRRAMHAHRTKWDLVFAHGAAAALESLADAPADVVISDMRMPGVDGAALLFEVARLRPEAIRIVLSGQTHADAVTRAVQVAHQFVAKPIDTPSLVRMLERLDRARELLPDAVLRRTIASKIKLPVAAPRLAELARLCEKPAVTPDEIAAVIERDPVLTVRILQISNSAFFGFASATTSLVEVVQHLGVETVRELVREGHLAEAIDECSGCICAELSSYAFAAAQIAGEVVSDPARADAAFVTALLHDIGALWTTDAAVRPRAGAYLLSICGLPEEIVAVVAQHSVTESSPAERLLAEAVATATRLAACAPTTEMVAA